ncbi:ADP-ribose pyrophosphatase [Limimonas halophila]|uniref:ADP-ribose pyrophosphatase n=1 Tax=Limimonas halophila TaxID=1082479 RepID=A0A1G7NEJ9_9PROT|nr:NUDIX domain-containing protein [Limimonas halophila]SDF72464.1 ADP-ribose pyrophosphatase [Limimonas halophila]
MANGPRLTQTDVPSDVEIVSAETPYDGYFRIDRYQLRHRLHDGGWSGTMTREVFERGHAVAVLPYDPVRESVVLLRQFRVPALAAGKAAWQTEVVAGIIEAGEDPEAVARRETVEECGLEARDLRLIHHYLVSPGGTTETVRLYAAVVDSTHAGGTHGVAAEHEDIEAVAVGFEQAQAMLADGTIDNAPAIIALQWLALNRESLRRRHGIT